LSRAGLMTAAGFRLNIEHGPVVAGSGRAIVPRLWRAPHHNAVDRSCRVHLVAGRLRTGFSVCRASHLLFEAPVAAA